MMDEAMTLRTVESIARMEARIAELTARATAAEARVAELLSDRADAAGVLVTEVERAQTAERRAAELSAALREYAPQCYHCPRVRTQMWRVDSLRKRGLCDVCARSYSPCEDTPDAAVLRSLDGVSR